MKRKQRSISYNAAAAMAIVLVIAVWALLSECGIVPQYMLPSPFDVCKAFIRDFWLLARHTRTTLMEAAIGLSAGVLIGVALAVVMDWFAMLERTLRPLILLTQTVPSIALAPLLVLWFGYGVFPKVVLIVLCTFYPITIGLINGFHAIDPDMLRLMKTMGASKWQIFRMVKLPGTMSPFFAGLRISASYGLVGAVISEWLGGFEGLGVYMIRVKKAYAFDKMFAVIALISALSLLLIKLVDMMHQKMMPWENTAE